MASKRNRDEQDEDLADDQEQDVLTTEEPEESEEEEEAASGSNGAAAHEEDSEEAEPPPVRREARPKKKAKASRPPRKRAKSKTKARRSAVEDDEPDPIGAVPEEPEPELEEEGPSPLETMSRSPTLEVTRTFAHGPGQGFPEGDTSVGPLQGGVSNRWNFREELWARAGGGAYEVRGILHGKEKTLRVPIPGPSKPLNPTDDAAVYYETPMSASSAAYNQGASYRQPMDGGWYPPQGGPPGGPSYGGGRGEFLGYDPYGRPIFSPPAHYTSPADVGRAYGGIRPQDDQETAALRQELDLAKEQARVAQEQSRMAEVRRETEAREAAHRSELDRVLAEVKSIKEGSGSQGAQQRFEEERLAREQRREEEREERQKRRDEEDQRRRDEEKRWEREYRDRKDKEEREAAARRERQELEDKARREDSQRAEKHLDRMMTLLTTNQQKPGDVIDQILKLKKLDGDGGSEIDKMTKWAEGMATLKDAFGGDGGGEGQIGQAERLVRTVGEAITPALGEIGSIIEKKDKARLAAQQPQQPQVVYVPAPAPQGYAPQPGYFPVPQQQATQQPVPADAAQMLAGAQRVESEAGDVSPQQWGKILAHVVDNAIGGRPPDEAASHLLTVLKTIEALPALDSLANARVPMLKGKVKLLLLTGRVTDPHYVQKMQQFVSIGEFPDGVRWLEEFLEAVRVLYKQIQQLAQQRQQQSAPTPAPQGIHPTQAQRQWSPRQAAQPGPQVHVQQPEPNRVQHEGRQAHGAVVDEPQIEEDPDHGGDGDGDGDMYEDEDGDE